MIRCPHCGKQSISTIARLCRPFDSQTTCPACGANLKIRMKWSSFILPIYLFCLQVRLIEYREVTG